MTNQELMNLAVNHLISQEVPSCDVNGYARYHGINDTKSVVGILISEDIYYPDMESSTIVELVHGDLSHLVDENQLLLLKLLENINHEWCMSQRKNSQHNYFSSMMRDFRSLCLTFRLEFPDIIKNYYLI